MSEKTVHSQNTPHGYITSHKYPSNDTTVIDTLNDLSVQLYPTGRAWYRPEKGIWEGFHEAINISFARLINDSKNLINQNIPDNDNFNEDDATLWEYRLGLISNTSLDLETRKQAIKRKLGHPNNVKARQHPLFIQNQLQLAGFDVYVHENTVPYKTPESVASTVLGEVQHEDNTQHGDSSQHGGESFTVIANSIEEIESYSIGGDGNLWATFFIGGPSLGDVATVPLARLKEFKELVIKLKPAHTVAFTFINYI